jgi:hypothetical protein
LLVCDQKAHDDEKCGEEFAQPRAPICRQRLDCDQGRHRHHAEKKQLEAIDISPVFLPALLPARRTLD